MVPLVLFLSGLHPAKSESEKPTKLPATFKIPKTVLGGSVKIPQNYFYDLKVGFLRWCLISGTHAHTKHDVLPTHC